MILKRERRMDAAPRDIAPPESGFGKRGKIEIVEMYPKTPPGVFRRHSTRLTRAAEIYLETSFYEGKCIADTERVELFTKSVIEEAMRRLNGKVEPRFLVPIEGANPTDIRDVEGLIRALKRYAEHLDTPAKGEAKSAVMLVDGVVLSVQAGEIFHGSGVKGVCVNSIHDSCLIIAWDNGAKIWALKPGEGVSIGNTNIVLRAINDE